MKWVVSDQGRLRAAFLLAVRLGNIEHVQLTSFIVGKIYKKYLNIANFFQVFD